MTKKKSFKALCGAKKRSYQGKRRQELVDAGKNPSKFWHVIKKSTVAATAKSPITDHEWLSYFQSLLFTDVTHDGNDVDVRETRDESADVLNDPITEAEVTQCVIIQCN